MVSGPGQYSLKGPLLPFGAVATILEVRAYFAIGWVNDSACIWSTHDGQNSYPGLPQLDLVEKIEPLAVANLVKFDGRKS